MAARSAFAGAVEFGGFPVNIKMFGRVKSRAGESFKSLAPTDKLPVRSVYLDTDGNEVGRPDVIKGVKVGKDQYAPLPAEAVEAIGSAEKSTTLTPDQFVPLATLPRELAVSSYTVIPDSDVAGADKSTNLLWNGLRESGLAYVSRITMRAGARDSIIAFYADDSGMYAVALPFKAELADVPAFAWTADEKAAALFQQFVDGQYEVAEFDHDALTSDYRDRRQAAIDAALAGNLEEIPQADAPTKSGPDLMAALEQAVAETGAKPKPKAKAKKAAAKRAKVAA